MTRKLTTLFFFSILIGTLTIKESNAQCCAGGSGSPIVGGASQGVLAEGQLELNTNLQLISSKKFYDKDKATDVRFFDSYSSSYEYLKVAYGINKCLTVSIESGYYFQKKEIGFENDPVSTYTAHGIGDLIIFPRFKVFDRIKNGKIF